MDNGNKHCSFCGKSESEVFYLIYGPKVHICDECILLSGDIIQEARDRVERGEPKRVFLRSIDTRVVPIIKTKVTTTTEVELGIETAASWFCGLSDDEMSQFFCAVAKQMIDAAGPCRAGMMWFATGRHLAMCECSTDEGREMIRDIWLAIDAPNL